MIPLSLVNNYINYSHSNFIGFITIEYFKSSYRIINTIKKIRVNRYEPGTDSFPNNW